MAQFRQLSLPGDIVKIDNKLARAKISIQSLDMSRILAKLITCIRADEQDFREVYIIEVKDITDTKIGGKEYNHFKAVTRELGKVTVEIEATNVDGTNPSFSVIPVFSEIKYQEGRIKAQFSYKMKPFLLNLKKCFTQYNVHEYTALPSTYSQKVFELIKSWESVGEAIIPLNKLHDILNTPKSFRSNFKDFRKWVLEKAHTDIVTHTALRYTWQVEKSGRKVDKVHFTIENTNNNNIIKNKNKHSNHKKEPEYSQEFWKFALFFEDANNLYTRKVAWEFWQQIKTKELNEGTQLLPSPENIPIEQRNKLIDFLKKYINY